MTYSPHDLLPAPIPSTIDPPDDYFYSNVVKHLVPTTVRLMNTGLPIDLNRVEQLEHELDSIISDVHSTLAANSHIQAYLESRYATQIAEYQALQLSRIKPASDFLVPFDCKKLEHRSYFMHLYAQSQSLPLPPDTLPTGISKWSARDVQKLSASRPILQRLLASQLRPTETAQAMQLYAEHKADLRNKSTRDKINSPNISYPVFNPASPVQKAELFSMLNLQSEATSKTTGADKWDRAQLERLLHEVSDPATIELLQALIDFSFAAIVRNNFIEAFYNYTVDGRLHGQYKLFGAKSFRFTSSNPNMLNTPSTNSKFSKPIKRCFIAPPGFIIASVDYSALEDRVIASLTKDPNKCAIFTQGVDGHSLGACAYFPDEVSAQMPLTGDSIADAIHFKKLVDSGNKPLKDLRQDGKKVTFGLSYGAFPPKVAASLKCSLPKAEQIFNNYHNVLYPGVTDYRENYVLPTALANGRLHLGLGCYIKSDNPSRDIRTLNNASCQFWSILTLLAIHKINLLIDEAGYTDDIFVTSSIYDSIYFCVRNDAHLVKWLNDTLIPILLTPFIDGQLIANEAALDLGMDWSSLTTIPNDASLTHIQEILNGFETLHS